MPRILRLSLLPLIGLLFVTAAFLWCQRELRLRVLGQAAEGRIIGMALQRAGHADLLGGIDTSLALTLANGDRVETTHANYSPVSATYHPAGGAAPRALDAAALDPAAASSELSAELRRALAEAVRGETAIVRWTLQRENRRADDPLRVRRIEKIETVRGWFGAPAVPEVLGLRDDRLLLNEDGAASSHEGVVRIAAIFDFSDPETVRKNKGDTLVSYAYERNGEAVEPAKKDFFLQAEPYATEFRPVFAYEVAGRGVARLSHIGRHGGPTLALRLYTPCRVYFDSTNPEQAVVTALAGPVAGDPLAWFSRLCEGIFAQWGSAALILLAGLLFIATGLLCISLTLFPPRKLHLAEAEV